MSPSISVCALRSAVIYRKLSLGSQSEGGELRTSRLLSAHTSCRLQRRSLFAYLTDAIAASLGEPQLTIANDDGKRPAAGRNAVAELDDLSIWRDASDAISIALRKPDVAVGSKNDAIRAGSGGRHRKFRDSAL